MHTTQYYTTVNRALQAAKDSGFSREQVVELLQSLGGLLHLPSVSLRRAMRLRISATLGSSSESAFFHSSTNFR